MGRFDTTKATIDANIKQNGNQEITGSILNSVMTEMVDATDAQLSKLEQEKLVQGKGIKIEDNTISVLIDSDLSTASTNPVQNNVITTELERKVEEQDVKALILKEHGYFKYNKSENLVYFKGYTAPDWIPARPWTINASVGAPLTVHMLIPNASSEAPISTNKFELYGANLEAPYMTWVYDGLLYTLKFGEDLDTQIITIEPYNESEGGSYDDTEIRQELTELSAEVSGLSEKIDNLPSGESSVFEAVYGVTTHAEVLSAFKEGKHCLCVHNDLIYNLVRVTETDNLLFACVNQVYAYTLTLTMGNAWFPTLYTIEKESNKVKTISESSTDTQYPSAKAVYDALQNVGGGGMTTPSGDPMHYMFEAVGATYNATDADIPMVGIYGDSYVHKAGYWHLNELGDITNEEMRLIYNERYPTKTMRYMQEWFREASARTTLSSLTQTSSTQGNYIGTKAKCETMLFTADINGEIMLANLADGFYRAEKLRKILGILNMSSATAINNTSLYCPMLEYVRFKGVKVSANLSLAPMLSNASILYIIQNETATSAIVITLHADAYARAMADADIQAALTAHPNVSLAK